MLEECISDHGHERMTMKTMPRPSLEVVEAEPRDEVRHPHNRPGLQRPRERGMDGVSTPAQLADQGETSGWSSACDLRPSTFLPVINRLRSLAPLSLATTIALSNSLTAPSICRISFDAGVSSRNYRRRSA